MDRESTTSSPARFGFGRFRFVPLPAVTQSARRRRVLLATLLVVGGATGTVLAAHFSSATARPLRAALLKSPLVGAGATQGGVVVETATPTILHYVPGATFALAVIVTNKAGAPVTLEGAAADVLPHSPLRQIGTRLIAFTPRVCPQGASCPFFNPIGSPPYGAEIPVALRVEPGHEALLQLHFKFRECSPATGVRVPTTTRVTVTYVTPDGSRVRQPLALADSTPQLERITRAEGCNK